MNLQSEGKQGFKSAQETSKSSSSTATIGRNKRDGVPQYSVIAAECYFGTSFGDKPPIASYQCGLRTKREHWCDIWTCVGISRRPMWAGMERKGGGGASPAPNGDKPPIRNGDKPPIRTRHQPRMGTRRLSGVGMPPTNVRADVEPTPTMLQIVDSR